MASWSWPVLPGLDATLPTNAYQHVHLVHLPLPLSLVAEAGMPPSDIIIKSCDLCGTGTPFSFIIPPAYTLGDPLCTLFVTQCTCALTQNNQLSGMPLPFKTTLYVDRRPLVAMAY